MKRLINLADAPHFDFKMFELARPLGATTIGANVTRVPPGRAAFPFHHHYGNKEHFFVLSGSGQLRYGADTHPVKPHDYIATPAGGPQHAHQLINTGTEDLVYLAISTSRLPEIVGYPDSQKTSAVAVPSTQEPPYIVRNETKGDVTYWDRQDGHEVVNVLATDS